MTPGIGGHNTNFQQVNAINWHYVPIIRPSKLMEYAKLCKVERLVTPYLEAMVP